ncbi:hypothetical protein B1R32_101234 [Abditibacterium utsteinense]|uniref:Quinate 5-dehydrogenase n=1 Tax=Abditibacterium utsteinense TaxID=1960156 RepID=A0A2S8SXG0_9BACT|nr:quinate 5-dehydrogenase [Abditibacterium utsteinense]PQV65492.1 hypothetical protein B1R32_101234 [Abditibacterium utsteinense]
MPDTDAAPAKPLHVVSISLGSKARDHIARAQILGRDWILERRGTDGGLAAAAAMISELDGHVAAIGLGGIDLNLRAGGRNYLMRDAQILERAAKKTPVVDGSGLKDTLERATIQTLDSQKIIDFQKEKVLLTCAVDRFGMAEELVAVGADVTFGDLFFILNVPIRMTKLATVKRLGALILPVACRLPFKMLYPTGKAQTEILDSKSHRQLFEANTVIAGDFLLIRRYLPADLKGKTILTNTVTSADIELLKSRGAARLITTTPEFEGRSFGTNVMEGVFAALGAVTPDDYRALLKQLDWQPRVVTF